MIPRRNFRSPLPGAALPLAIFWLLFFADGRGIAREKYEAGACTPRGCAVVVRDIRGRGNSEDAWTWMTTDREDGYDTVEWIAKQPWSNGRIGMTGCSCVGATRHPSHIVLPLVSASEPDKNQRIAPSC